MSAVNRPASEKSANFRQTLQARLGREVDLTPADELEQEFVSEEINEMRLLIPATEGQIGLASKLVADHVPGKFLPAKISDKQASDLIQSLMARVPTKTMLERLFEAERKAEIVNPNPPKTTKALYDRESHLRNLSMGDAVSILLDTQQERNDSWGLVDAQLAPATAQREDESAPESPGSSVYKNA